uniref:Uncharacterized protein n=1 Tax=Lactuca sativa TaxID=4236 RepID=A0A9R1UNW3_LACSA|nr:hypothetical protein LSAT_V11C800428670 [Lactuca sativa]
MHLLFILIIGCGLSYGMLQLRGFHIVGRWNSLQKQAWFIYLIGGGNIGGPNDGEAEIEFPEDIVVCSIGDHIHSILQDELDESS